MLGGTAAPSAARQPPAQLFQLGAAPAGAPSEWRRWGAALAVAAVVHAGLFAALLAVRPAPREAVAPDAPELVLYAFAPPPPPPAGGPAGHALAAPRPVVHARAAPRPLVPKKLAQAAPVKAPEPEPVKAPEPEPAAPAQVAAATAAPTLGAGGSSSALGMAGGAQGGVVGGQLGGVAGAPLQLKQVKQRPQLLAQLALRYPRQAKADGITGTVLVSFIIGADGHVEEAHTRVLRSIPALDAAAVEAVNRLRFTPGLGPEGRPVRVLATLPIDFSLR
ncbi:energy transducer TonB [Aggregicoccus sp. 17bor-14]|nr:energy transducer TonB [Simulacricoccus sp. 17bor-14]MRI88722.1 energy transducer TonB [Aggregicoccus sp. 17bor-14]